MTKLWSLLFLILSAAICRTPLESAKQDYKLLLIVGCARSGTSYITDYLNACGIDVAHEAPGKNGCVSWAMVENKYSFTGPSAKNTKFIHVFHQIRHPLDVISSFYFNYSNLNMVEWEFIRRYLPQIRYSDSLLVQSAKYWFYWNLKAESMSEWTYRIEDIEGCLEEFQSRSQLPLSREILRQTPLWANHWNQIQYKFTWQDLQAALPPNLYNSLRTLARKYGYTN